MTITYYFTQPDPLAPQTKARSVDINALSNAVRVAFEKIPAMGQDWSGLHDFTAGKVRVRAPIDSDEPATRGYVDTLKFAASPLPAYPVLGSYNLLSKNGVIAWERSALLKNRRKMAEAIALQFSLA